MRRTLLPLTILIMLSAALAGCVDDTADVADDPDPGCPDPCPDAFRSADGRDLRTELRANDTLEAPVWAVGDHFGQHIFDGDGDPNGYHIDSMVIEETGSAWVLATNSEDLARRHAFWDYPFLGAVQKSDLATTGYDVDWDFLFEFPLTEGKTWQREIELPHSSFFWTERYTVDFTVGYEARVDTFEGVYPGFEITGVTGTGETLFSYYYVPQIRWYDQFYWYDLETDDPSDYRLKAISMGTGTNWTGEYYVAETVGEHFTFNFFCPFLTDEFCQPKYSVDSFTLQSADNHLFGLVVAAAWGGHSRVLVTPPEGDPRAYEHTNDEVPDMESGEPEDIDAVTNIAWYDEPAIPGEWRFANSGGGVFWGGIYVLQELATTSHSLGDAAA